MTLPPERIQVGKCYLMQASHVWRVVRITGDGRAEFMHRLGHMLKNWKIGAEERRTFGATTVREVPCDWRP